MLTSYFTKFVFFSYTTQNIIKRKNHVDAEKFYQRALEADPENKSAFNNYAIFLAVVRRDTKQARLFFQRAVELGHGQNLTHITNYTAFLAQNSMPQGIKFIFIYLMYY